MTLDKPPPPCPTTISGLASSTCLPIKRSNHPLTKPVLKKLPFNIWLEKGPNNHLPRNCLLIKGVPNPSRGSLGNYETFFPSSITSTQIKIFANFKMVCFTRRKNLTFSLSSFLKLLSTAKNLSVGKNWDFQKCWGIVKHCLN